MKQTSLVRTVAPPGAANDNPVVSKPPRRDLGDYLVQTGRLSARNLAWARNLMARGDAGLDDILLAHGVLDASILAQAQADRLGTRRINPVATPPDPRLIGPFGARFCLRSGIVPWKRVGGGTIIATADPENFKRLLPMFPVDYGPFLMSVADRDLIENTLLRSTGGELVARAETCVDSAQSCRGMKTLSPSPRLFAILTLAAAPLILAPQTVFALLGIWAIASLILTSGLKLTAAFVQARQISFAAPDQTEEIASPEVTRLPVVSILVPLFREREIANHLIKRLEHLDYPRELLDICLIVEQDDHTTRRAVSATALPHWFRVITVPCSSLRTKPRALNYALNFCRGTIIGIYDAEDAPAPDQIHTVVQQFHARGPKVACLQGVLDFYNARSNWLSRCFTIEYAAWFRLILPGYERLGLAVPLGGTTLFLRRDILEKLGGWDAHNVTEDADLGIRLARRGYRTELIKTVTEEEANCRIWPWIRQRSRWLKGFALTWLVHMRSPRRLLADLGWWRFFGFQVMFLGTLTQFLLAPVLWSFLAITFGQPHPLLDALPGGLLLATGLLFLLTEVLTIMLGMYAVSGKHHRHLTAWVPTLHVYFLFGTLAAFKAVYEIFAHPFYWDKTQHGVFAPPQKE